METHPILLDQCSLVSVEVAPNHQSGLDEVKAGSRIGGRLAL